MAALLGIAIAATSVVNFLAFTVEQDVGRDRDLEVDRLMSHLDEIQFFGIIASEQLAHGDAHWVIADDGAMPWIRRRIEELSRDLKGLYGADTDRWAHARQWFTRIGNAVVLLILLAYIKQECVRAMRRWLEHLARGDLSLYAP